MDGIMKIGDLVINIMEPEKELIVVLPPDGADMAMVAAANTGYMYFVDKRFIKPKHCPQIK
jgi:hypothetical protein